MPQSRRTKQDPTFLISFLVTAMSGCLLASCGSSGGGSSSTAAGGANVSIVTGAASKMNMAYSPNPFVTTAGTPVVFMNGDSSNHTVTSDSNAFNSGTLNAGGTFTYTFTTPGTYTYHCNIHPSMVGTITVN